MNTPEQAEWDKRYSGPELVWGAGPNRFVAQEVAELTPGTAVDLGTGEGRNAIWLAEQGWRVTAVDFSSVGLDRAARLAAERGVSVEWVHASLLDWRPGATQPGAAQPRATPPETARPGAAQPETTYDLVLLAYIQLPPDSLARVFRAAADAVAPGGTLLVIGHDRDNISRGYGGPQDPSRLYTTAAVTAELDGLTVRRAEQVLRPVSTPDGERTAIDTLVRAVRA